MKISLLQWNIWFKEDIDNIITELKRINADIVTIQELCIFENDKSNLEKLNLIYPFVYYEIADTLENRSQGNAILSKYPFLRKSAKYVQEPTENKDDFSKEGRIYLEATIDIYNKLLIIGTTHLSYTHNFNETELKNREIEKLISYIENHKSNYILSGDLNAKQNSNYVEKISKYLVHHNTTNTWTTKPFSYNGFEEDKLNWKLDYIFTTQEVNVLETNVVETKYSDHLPILVDIEL